jgi:S1-C subfamily serine protease
LSGRLATTDKALAKQNDQAALLDSRLSSLEAAALDAKSHDVAKTAELVKHSLVTIEVGEAMGSAFAVSTGSGSSDVVTNFHVVADY